MLQMYKHALIDTVFNTELFNDSRERGRFFTLGVIYMCTCKLLLLKWKIVWCIVSLNK